MKKEPLFIFLFVLIMIALLQIIIYKEPYPEGNYYNLSKGFLAYEKLGSGEQTIIMVHGSPGSKEDFRNLKKEFPDYKVYLLDMYGFGDSQMKVKNYGSESQADVIKEFMEKENVKETNILGYSWGSLVAIDFAYKYPELTDNLILLDGSGIQEGEPTGNYYTERGRTIFSYPFTIYYPGGFLGGINWKKGFILSFYQTDQRLVEGKMKTIKIPTLIIHGEEDTIVMPWVAEKHHRLIESSTLKFFHGGHIKLFSDTKEIGEIINDYLKTNNKSENGK